MNRNERRLNKKQAEHKARRMMTGVHILIAVVAIIECFILVSFTTYSWIESNSSLIIQNGPESSQVGDHNIETDRKKMDIATALHSTINLNYTGTGENGAIVDDDFAPLNSFFSEVKYFQFAKATSSDGRTLFFPCRNNTYSTAGRYRRGDTIDYNTSFIYFDFIINNTDPEHGDTVENRDVYFDNTQGYTDIFKVTGDGLTPEQKTAIENAMRMSITTQVGSSAPYTKIFSKKAYSGTTDYNTSTEKGSYKSIDASTGQNGTLNRSYAYDVGSPHDRNTWVTTSALADSVYTLTNNVISSEKLFVAKKNAETKVSFRIWLDVWDPYFRSAFGLDSLDYSQYATSNAAYWNIPDANVGIKFRLKTSGNDLRSIYFDDYTLTNQTGINIDHLTDENPNYSVWFYTWQPAVAATNEHPPRPAGYYAIQLSRESRDATHTLWSANTATASEMDYLKGADVYNTNATNAACYSGTVANRYTQSYFCYGDFNTKTAIYKWALPAAPAQDNEDFIFNAYSYMPNSSYTASASVSATVSGQTITWSDCVVPAGGTKLGVGIWQDNDASSMTLLKFKDMATAITTDSYNGGANFQIMNAQAVSDNHSNYLVFANDYNNATLNNNFSADVEERTAAMYYDSSDQVFKSYVPTGWLTGNTGVSFTYCPGGVFRDPTSNYAHPSSGAALRWYSGASAATQNGSEYIYTALGYSNRNGLDSLGGIGYTAGFYNGSEGFMKGVGTWSAVEQVKFCTDLIDSDLNSAYRYFVSTPVSGSYSQNCYVMIPDESNMTFSAYIPSGTGSSTAGAVNFVRLDAVKNNGVNDVEPQKYWYGNHRTYSNTGTTYGTFYPVNLTGTAVDTTDYTHGYWNLSVLVDGTYENLIYDTLTDGSGSSYTPTVTSQGDATTKGVVDYSSRINYGLLEVSFDGTNWVTVCDDTTNTYSVSDSSYSYSQTGVIYAGMIDPYRFYVSAEGESTVYWRWTPYKGYTVSIYADHDNDPSTAYTLGSITAADTMFSYNHNVTDAASSGIYVVVTEARSQ